MLYGSPCAGRGLRLAVLLVAATAVSSHAVPTREVAITVDNTAGTILADHQVSFTLDTATLIAAGKLQADGDDLRVTDANGSSLCHYLEGPLNSASTVVWVKLPTIPAGSTLRLSLLYGDAASTDAGNPTCTFDYWEDFDDTTTDFGVACGDLVWSINGGRLFLTWSTKGIFLASPSMALSPPLVAEADVTSAAGLWPGLHWFKSGTQYSYALTHGNNGVRISTTPATTTDGDACAAHNWISTVAPASSAVGIWSLVWPATGTQEASFPVVGPLSATSNEHQRDTPLQLGLGGIATGAGGMSVGWVRTRRYTAVQPTATLGPEHDACGLTPSLCNDANPCTSDTCAPVSGCLHAAPDCDDHNACTADGCDVSTGCTHTAVDCDDQDACTTDLCDLAAGCQYLTIGCGDANACTVDTCAPLTGCGHATLSCDDANVCTTESCDPITGCGHTAIDCNDADVCTTESCNAVSGCAHAPIACDDHSVCTTDTCDPATGCRYAPIDCDDDNACFDEVCDAVSGCGHVAVSCDDDDACTTDRCDLATGCAHLPISCDDDDACSRDTCDPVDGCRYAAVTCDDRDGCTSDTCDPTIGCGFARLACDDHDRCTDDTCTPPNGCAHEPTRGSSFPSLGCQLDWLREDVRSARASAAVTAWFGRRIDKARARFNRAQAGATVGDRAAALHDLRAVRALLSRFLARAGDLRQRGRLGEPTAMDLRERATGALANLLTLLASL